MIENLASWNDLLFLATFILMLIIFHHSNNKPNKLTLFIVLWSLAHAALAYNGFYQNIDDIPPRFSLTLVPTTFLIIYGLLPKQQNWFLKNRNLKLSTFLHGIRLPVEIVLHALFAQQMIPKLMTYEGKNFDILIGISAIIIGALFLKNKIDKKTLLIWNYLGLAFILIIYFIGIFSSELPFQQFALERPNQAMKYFPYILLPATIVPIVIWTHISDIIKLRKETA